MAGQNANTDQFEAYFKRADLDGDGRISGNEAVAFFQGSGLSKQVLAQIWMHADQSHTGFLGRQEFYNALKLVTVAQSKRELTPDIVKAAIYGPAAAKIPAPQINPVTPAHQFNSTAAVSAPQMGSVAPPTSQNFGFRGPGVLNANMNQQYFPSQQSQSMRPPQVMPVGVPRPPLGTAGPEYRGGSVPGQNQAIPADIASRPPQVVPATTAGPGGLNPSISNDWFGRAGGSQTGLRGVSPATPSAASKPQTLVSTSSQSTASRALVVSGNGNASDSVFGGDMFSASFSSQKQEPSVPAYSASGAPTSSAIVPVSSGAQPPAKPNALDSLSAFSMQPAESQLQHNRSSVSSGQQVSAQSSASFASSGISVGVGNSVSGNNQLQWPKMKPSDVQKYTKVFMEVDTDRDGKITGEQARKLFLSWRLPREVLKQVWDLSDQDNDSMLSLREFCFALYLMERYREGRPLPGALPSNLMFDETLSSMTGQPNVNYGNAAWGPSPGIGFGQQQGMATRPVGPATGVRPPVPMTASHVDGGMTSSQQKPQALVLDDSFANQLYNGEKNSMNSMPQEVTSAGKKVDEKEKTILDSKEKIEFYRSKMQDIVLYKSRCDNRLNEITERASADKREAETLGKKYEERYKQVAEIASKLTIEDARFREIQERKMELQQAIVNMEQGGSTDGMLQVRVDRIQSDLEELMKALTERSKKHGLDVKSIALIELPTGWQPGIQEGAALWDEDWDKFEDEGFGNELTFDAKNASPKQNSSSMQRENGSLDGSLTPDSLSHADEKPGLFSSTGEHPLESESAYIHSEDELARSPVSSPAARTAVESPSPEYSDVHRRKSAEADAETHRSFDDSTWGAFDNNDDTDSVWGLNPVKTKDSDSERHRDFFGSSDFGVSPVGTDSPSAESVFQRKSHFAFDDSVPSTPLSKFGYSPPRFSGASRDNFDSFSRFDSFSNHDSGFSTQPDRLTRFDSMNSTKDFGGFSRFDSINSSRDFGGEKFSRFDSMNSTQDFGGGERLTRFDSINSTRDFGGNQGFSFDDRDQFGSSGPFKVSSDNRSPKKSSDNRSAF